MEGSVAGASEGSTAVGPEELDEEVGGEVDIGGGD